MVLVLSSSKIIGSSSFVFDQARLRSLTQLALYVFDPVTPIAIFFITSPLSLDHPAKIYPSSFGEGRTAPSSTVYEMEETGIKSDEKFTL